MFGQADESGPDRPRLALRIGVTGHRRLAGPARSLVAEQVRMLLSDIADQVRQIGRDNADLFAPGEPSLAILSQLASGADQLVARAGLGQGYAIKAVLPFAPEQFAADFDHADREDLQALIAQAETVWHLPGERAEADQAYALAGEATVAQSDLLLAIWDGATARGPGGTGDVVEYAIRRGVPVIHVQADGQGAAMLLWAGADGIPATLLHRHNVPRRPADRATLTAAVAMLLLPAAEPAERLFLETFVAERAPRLKLRPEFPLLLALAGVRPLRRTDLLAARRAADGGDLLDAAYGWADRLADGYAQHYRSGTVFNFVAAAAAVIVALLAFLVPAQKGPIVLIELLLIGGLIVNTGVGNRRQWHRRWLDYRYLAEKLRVMRSLKRLSVASPEADAAAFARDGRWTDFYAAAVWRQLTPATVPDREAVRALTVALATEEIDSQIEYHAANAARMQMLDHRLHRAGTLLFHATVAAGLISLAGLALTLETITDQAKLLTFFSAALPTAGAALFGIRGQGDFAGAAGRSARTAARLQRSAASLRDKPPNLACAARILEDAAGAMLDDLGEWRAVYTHRKLLIPA